MSVSREYLRAALRELEEWPGATSTLQNGSKHPRLVLEFAGRSRFMALPSTASDRHGGGRDAMIATLRQTLRGLGAARTPRGSLRQRSKEPSCVAHP